MNEYGYEITFKISPIQENRKRCKWAYKQCEAFERKLNAHLAKERKLLRKRR